MRIYLVPLLVLLVSETVLYNASGQGTTVGNGTFANLDFESAAIVPVSGKPAAFIQGAPALPDWTCYSDGTAIPPSSCIVIHDTVSLGTSSVDLFDGTDPMQVFQGQYTVALQSSSFGDSAGIGQSGQIPGSARSIFFDARFGDLRLTFNGQSIPILLLTSGANYSVFGANVGAYAGQTGSLIFTTGGVGQFAYLDDIRFGSAPVPEPKCFWLLALGMLIIWRAKPFVMDH